MARVVAIVGQVERRDRDVLLLERGEREGSLDVLRVAVRDGEVEEDDVP